MLPEENLIRLVGKGRGSKYIKTENQWRKNGELMDKKWRIFVYNSYVIIM